jgi:DNA-binding protein Fis
MANYNGQELLAAMGIKGPCDMDGLLQSIRYALIDNAIAYSRTTNADGEQNNTAAAAYLGINRTTLVMQLKKRAE